ncbi:hypothetical protein ACFFK0_28090 [Paenibacillus chartarius]|uniref:Uncharacterized protein n=1 Tax=Paenibacillus chartarius TaxID=747481 RepID=A0ABV6DUC4_9BACL
MEEYERIVELFKSEAYPDKGWVMMTIHWESAKTDPYLNQVSCEFPGYLGYLTSFADVSPQYGFLDICDELVTLIKKNNLPIPPKVKAHYVGKG